MKTTVSRNPGLLPLSEVCEKLDICAATARNWVRLGKLKPAQIAKKRPLFAAEDIEELLDAISSPDSLLLKRRRNKRQAGGTAVYKKYIDNPHNETVTRLITAALPCPPPDSVLRLLLANCALQLFAQKRGLPGERGGLIESFLDGGLSFGEVDRLIDDLLVFDVAGEDVRALREPLSRNFHYRAGEDLLGFLYLSLKDIKGRKASGSYYTPIAVVDQLLAEVEAGFGFHSREIVDPACGSGNFFLRLRERLPSAEGLYGIDRDEVSVLLARINMALAFDGCDVELLYSNFKVCDALRGGFDRKFDLVIGNPPWGGDYADISVKQLRGRYGIPNGGRVESFDLFVLRATEMIREEGFIALVVPEAFLNVRRHSLVRSIVEKTCSLDFVSYIDNVFPGVCCPAVLLGLQKSAAPTVVGCRVLTKESSFVIGRERSIAAAGVSLRITDEEWGCIERIERTPGVRTLKGAAEFALGIVTGDNERFISDEPRAGYEVVLRGKDISAYRYRRGGEYIRYAPEFFQQAAPARLYRAPEKLFYRFISNSLVFAYDDKQTLSLNSCNMLIPQIPGLDIKYMLALLNSRIAEYYWRKKFNSAKVLRSQLEEIPIAPVDDERQREIVALADAAIAADDAAFADLYERIDGAIMGVYGLKGRERRIICAAVGAGAI